MKREGILAVFVLQLKVEQAGFQDRPKDEAVTSPPAGPASAPRLLANSPVQLPAESLFPPFFALVISQVLKIYISFQSS